jgi:serpin B
LLTLALLVSGCETPSSGDETARSDKSRAQAPDVSGGQLDALVAGNTEFALDVYRSLARAKPDENLFLSPHSISIALAMLYGGARGDTESQMAEALHLALPQGDLHRAVNALDLQLSSAAEGDFKLHIANALWAQTGYEFLPDYLDLLAEDYGAGMRLLDFKTKPEPARSEINDWVSRQTERKIENLIPRGVINDLTRLVLTNAIYFDADWRSKFEPRATRREPFTLLDGGSVTVDMMHQSHGFDYAEGDGWQAVSLPYKGGEFSLVVVLPERARFEEVEAGIDGDRVQGILGDLEPRQVRLSMPKLDYGATFSLKGTLSALGMSDAFDPLKADLSGMDGTRDLSVTEVLHKALVKVDEEGTVAAAATAVIVGVTSAPPMDVVKMVIDHPFLFLIRHDETGAILFLGRVLDPTAA